MPNTSATGGYLVPAASPAPLEDQAFEDFLHDIFVGLTGLDNENVRPRWQPEPPNQLAFGVDWIAFGIMRQDADTYAAIEHDPIGDGADHLQRHETVEVLISSYGDHATANLTQLRDGLQVEQNRAILTTNAMGLEKTGEIIPAPTLVKDRWLRRFDMTMTFRRQIRRTYQVLNLLSAHGTIDAEQVEITINVNP